MRELHELKKLGIVNCFQLVFHMHRNDALKEYLGSCCVNSGQMIMFGSFFLDANESKVKKIYEINGNTELDLRKTKD